ncbi:hypothetical protein ACOTD7_19220 [Achromobacter xylosoxidans]
MKARALVKYGAIALMLGATGFVSGIGILTLVFAPKTGTFAPVNGSDAAAWIQAVGSIGAILGAFWLAGRQARDQRSQVRDQRLILDKQICSAIEVAYSAANAIREKAESNSVGMFLEVWSYYWASHTETITEQFKTLPLYVLGSPDRIEPASRILAVLADVRNLVLDLTRSESGIRPLEHAQMCTQLRMYGKILDSSIKRFRQMNEKYGPR